MPLLVPFPKRFRVGLPGSRQNIRTGFSYALNAEHVRLLRAINEGQLLCCTRFPRLWSVRSHSAEVDQRGNVSRVSISSRIVFSARRKKRQTQRRKPTKRARFRSVDAASCELVFHPGSTTTKEGVGEGWALPFSRRRPFLGRRITISNFQIEYPPRGYLADEHRCIKPGVDATNSRREPGQSTSRTDGNNTLRSLVARTQGRSHHR